MPDNIVKQVKANNNIIYDIIDTASGYGTFSATPTLTSEDGERIATFSYSNFNPTLDAFETTTTIDFYAPIPGNSWKAIVNGSDLWLNSQGILPSNPYVGMTGNEAAEQITLDGYSEGTYRYLKKYTDGAWPNNYTRVFVSSLGGEYDWDEYIVTDSSIENDTVTLYFEYYEVPDVWGYSSDDAYTIIIDSGYGVSNFVSGKYVINQSLLAGNKVPKGEEAYLEDIYLTLSDWAPDLGPMPNLSACTTPAEVGQALYNASILSPVGETIILGRYKVLCGSITVTYKQKALGGNSVTNATITAGHGEDVNIVGLQASGYGFRSQNPAWGDEVNTATPITVDLTAAKSSGGGDTM